MSTFIGTDDGTPFADDMRLVTDLYRRWWMMGCDGRASLRHAP